MAVAAKYARLKYNPKGEFGLEIAHLHSEVSEVYRATIKSEGHDKEVLEFADVILNTMVAAKNRNISVTELLDGIEKKSTILGTRIVTERLEEREYHT